MSTNKNALIRYKILDECFSNPYKKFFIEDLIETCMNKLSEYLGMESSVSRRQILEDIKFMKSFAGYDAPIETYRESRRGYYRYSDLDFSILKKPLTKYEKDELKNSFLILGRMKNLQDYEWVESVQKKLELTIDDSLVTNNIIDFEENIYLKGLHFFGQLYDSITKKHLLSVEYEPFYPNIKAKYIISPYFLKQYNNRWFLLGWNHADSYLQNLALDRIISVEYSVSEPYKECAINFKEYFEDIIGVTNFIDQEVQKIEIQLTEDIVPYIKTKPIHESQRITKENILIINVKLNYELEATILSYGEKMKVISPTILQDKIINRVVALNNLYTYK